MNITRGIGRDQLACHKGAQLFPFNDRRMVSGATVRRDPDGTLTVTPNINKLGVIDIRTGLKAGLQFIIGGMLC